MGWVRSISSSPQRAKERMRSYFNLTPMHTNHVPKESIIYDNASIFSMQQVSLPRSYLTKPNLNRNNIQKIELYFKSQSQLRLPEDVYAKSKTQHTNIKRVTYADET